MLSNILNGRVTQAVALMWVLLFALVSVPLHADSVWDNRKSKSNASGFFDERQYGVQKQKMLSMSEAIARAQRQFPGKVLSSRRSVNRSGDAVYLIKILSSRGEVRTIRISAKG